jgi:predicted RNase H-like nuclease (RuvC/YqgF family)
MLFCGIDPGITGAIAVLTADGAYVAVSDTPTIALTKARARAMSTTWGSWRRSLSPIVV